MKLLFLILLLAGPACAETVVAGRTIRSNTVIDHHDIAVLARTTPGALSRSEEVVGKEARVMLYAGRPIRPDDIGPPALVERNQLVTLLYSRGRLVIAAEGRALGRAAVGETVRVVNLSSRTTVSGRVNEAGEVVANTAGRN